MPDQTTAQEETGAIPEEGKAPQETTSSATQTNETQTEKVNPFLDKKALVSSILGQQPDQGAAGEPGGTETPPEGEPEDPILADLDLSNVDPTPPGVTPPPEKLPAPEAGSDYIQRIEKQAVENAELQNKIKALEADNTKREAANEVDFVDAFLELTPEEIESRFQTKSKDDEGNDVMVPALNGTQAKIMAQVIKIHVKKALSGISPMMNKMGAALTHQEKSAALVKANPGLLENESIVMKAVEKKYPKGVPPTVDRYQLIQDLHQQIVNARAARKATDDAQGKRTLSNRQATAQTASAGLPATTPKRWISQLAENMVSGK